MAKRSKKTTKDIPKEILNRLGSTKVVGEAQRIINMAVDILEEEVAAGICAAKEIEEKMIDVEEIRSRDPDGMINRLRKDAHEILDIMVDALAVVVHKMEDLRDDVVKMEDNSVAASQNGHIPIINNSQACKAGGQVEIPISLTNDKDEGLKKISFQKADLAGTNGKKILARNITFVPEQLELNPGERKVIVIHTKVPKSTPVGRYSGLFRDKNDPLVKMVLEIDIG